MRRKNWTKEKKYFFDKIKNNNFYNTNSFKNLLIFYIKKPVKLDKHKIIEFMFRKNFKENKYDKVIFQINYYFLYFMIKKISILNKKYFYRLFLKNNDNLLLLSPAYTFGRQYFEYRSIFFEVLKKKNLKGFFIYKNLFKLTNHYLEYQINRRLLIGYNFYLIKSNIKIFEFLNNILIEKDYNKIGKVKLYKDSFIQLNFVYSLNYFFNYNLFLLNVVEIYKINILLHIHYLK